MARVEINRSRIRALVNISSREELDEAAKTLLRLCKEESPEVTGDLIRSHEIEKPTPDRRIISANMPYARSVFDGDQERKPNRWMLRAIDRSRL